MDLDHTKTPLKKIPILVYKCVTVLWLPPDMIVIFLSCIAYYEALVKSFLMEWRIAILPS